MEENRTTFAENALVRKKWGKKNPAVTMDDEGGGATLASSLSSRSRDVNHIMNIRTVTLPSMSRPSTEKNGRRRRTARSSRSWRTLPAAVALVLALLALVPTAWACSAGFVDTPLCVSATTTSITLEYPYVQPTAFRRQHLPTRC